MKYLYAFLYSVIFLFGVSADLTAQACGCQNAGFEVGSVGCHRTSFGRVSSRDGVTLDMLGPHPDQHRIVQVSDGFDPIAERYCIENKQLPVVPEGGGRYAMRLGNARGGKRAESITMQFRVTPQTSFFLLSYAVLLQDPRHATEEQPRFELRIRNTAGQILDCGEYIVRADTLINGFENCGEWRVRPWTTAGFELQSYLGQDIQIEILTTDCSRGGHAGYAYINASCQPLELQLRGYCPGTNSAQLLVTEGFERYQWSTGDTTNAITINNPVPETAYAVTVTSATGCTLVLRDTLPTLEELPVPRLDPVTDTTVCTGSNFWFQPTGTGFSTVYSPTLGYGADSFLLAPATDDSYLFVVTDNYGCNVDSLRYTVKVDTLSSFITVDSVRITGTSCADGSDGAITVTSNASAITWTQGPTTPTITGLTPGQYEVRLTDPFGCYVDRTYSVPNPPPISPGNPIVRAVSCFGAADGTITITPTGGTPPYRLRGQSAATITILLNNLTSDTYNLEILDANGCSTVLSVYVPTPEPLTVSLRADSVTCAGTATGSLSALPTGGTPPYRYAWSDDNDRTTAQATGLLVGQYAVTVVDANGCSQSAVTTVAEPLPFTLTDLFVTGTTCSGGADGTARAVPAGGNGGYRFTWSAPAPAPTSTISRLAAGSYRLTLTDRKGCALKDTFLVPQPPPIVLNLQTDSVSCHGGEDGIVRFSATGGNGGFTFQSAEEPITSPLTGLTAGYVRITARDQKGCPASKGTQVAQPDTLAALITDQRLPNCRDQLPGTTTISVAGGNGGYRYLWSTGSQTATVSSFRADTFTLSVTDRKGCILSAKFPVLGLAAEILPVADFVNDDWALCAGAELGLMSSANNRFTSVQWSSTENLPCDTCFHLFFTPSDTASYQLIVEDVFACRDTTQVQIPVNHFQASLFTRPAAANETLTLCFGDEATLRPQAWPPWDSLRWEPAPFLSCLDCPNPTIRPPKNTRYRATVHHENGCTSELEQFVRVDRIACPQFIPTAISPNGDGLNDDFRIPSTRSIERIVEMEIFDRWGSLVYRAADFPFREASGWWNGKVQGRPASSATYLYQIIVEHFDGTREGLAGDFTLLR
ncbi:MAG: gliding motility-associated C-terminal domain-containing protein [Bacteroidota bacterium]